MNAEIYNCATDHQAQMLRILNEMGCETFPQDYVFYADDHPVEG
ncbi:MAG TPA: hypothetical protein PKD55_01205 [Bellilinea sp.]|nr:hypothetical protein [Bellilinea sp.]